MKPKVRERINQSEHIVRILYVEDNDLCRELMKKLFSRVDKLEAEMVSEGRMALQLAIKNRYDIIFLDIHLPDLSGYEVTRKLRRFESHHGVHTPIIAVTASAGSDDMLKCREAGMDDFIPKPISTKHLLSKIRQYSYQHETSV